MTDGIIYAWLKLSTKWDENKIFFAKFKNIALDVIMSVWLTTRIDFIANMVWAAV